MTLHVLAVNTGSSTVKLAVFDLGAAAQQALLRARLSFGPEGPRFHARDADGEPLPSGDLVLGRGFEGDTVLRLFDWIEDHIRSPIAAVGHRVVHGGVRFVAPAVLTDEVGRALERLAPLAPLHQLPSLAAAFALRRARPHLRQALAFDTAFHHGHAPVVDRLGLPRAFEAQGLRRFGFHGLSYEYLASRLRELDPAAAGGRVIAAHLGSGASLCAMQAGRSIDTTMGATPLDGLLMGTRCGALDPGAILFLQQTQGLDATQLSDLLYHRSGLLGVSGLSADMRVLLNSREPAAREAVELFVFRVARETAALAGTLEGLDALVFTAGVGENCPEIRSAVCERLAWLGLALDDAANLRGETKISAPDSHVAIWVIPTDEERMIAIHTQEALGMAAASADRPRPDATRRST
ncbi:acetate/propionate family kinase [Phenylobacterium sp.]|uniref:acetate/propionate family kinase n=1 Tax=Phenylobacterium sp. TaxID=1871053 RepID=UPI002FCC55E6